jgi:NADH dehydrogenase
MARTVLVTGGSGFVGSAVIDELLRRQFAVRALVRRRPIDRPGVTSAPGDLATPSGLDEALSGCDAVIHLVGIIAERPREGVTFQSAHVDATRNLLGAMTRLGIRRYAHMSALGTRANAVSAYHRTKWLAEELVRASGLDWTIFRPSMIHGPAGEFVKMAADWARFRTMPYLFMPYFGKGLTGFGGSALVQPVYVGDVARAFVDAVEGREDSKGKTYDLAGPQRMTWPQMYKMLSTAIVGRARATLPIPAWYARLLTSILPAAVLPFNRDQVIMSQEDNVGDPAPLRADFGWETTSMGDALKRYASLV